MYVRWREKVSKETHLRYLTAELVEAYRNDGRPRVGLVAYLGSLPVEHVQPSDMVRDAWGRGFVRMRFWLRALGNLYELHELERFDAEHGRATSTTYTLDALRPIVAAIEERVPPPQQRELGFFLGNNWTGRSLVGRDRYGHPRKASMAQREEWGLRLLEQLRAPIT